jgi:DNA-binding NarL/FixJ family response regulator
MVLTMTTTKNHRVFLVEDDQGTLQRMAKIVRLHPEMSLVGMAETYTDASLWLNNNKLDILLTDLGLPDGNGQQLIEQTREQHPKVDIMVISRFGDENSVVEAIKAGATGYLLKDEAKDHIDQSIAQLLKGGSPISPAIARYILDFFQSNEMSSSNTVETPNAEALLTPKEKMVLQYISRGYSNKEIARSLDISPHTVASHIKRIYRKLEVNSRNEAVFEGWRMGELSMHEQPKAQGSQKNPLQIAQALKTGGKSTEDIMDVLQLVFALNMSQGMKILQQLEVSDSELFAAAKNAFQADDKEIVAQMLTLGFNHEEALQAMLDQI